MKIPALFILIFYAGLHELGSNNFRNSSCKEKTADSACVSRPSFRFLWLWSHIRKPKWVFENILLRNGLFCCSVAFVKFNSFISWKVFSTEVRLKLMNYLIYTTYVWVIFECSCLSFHWFSIFSKRWISFTVDFYFWFWYFFVII